MNKDHIYKRRLLKLADYLDSLPPERFNYGNWVGLDWQGKQNLSCGTTACALGHAATMPALRKAGMRLFYNDQYNFAYVGMKNDSYDWADAPMNAAFQVFGLVEHEFAELFLPTSDGGVLSRTSSAKQVAKHIRDFANKRFK